MFSITLECHYCGDAIGDVAGPGGSEYCDSDCQRASRRQSLAAHRETIDP